MIVNVKKIIERNLREGDSYEGFIKKLEKLAEEHMRYDSEGLKRQLMHRTWSEIRQSHIDSWKCEIAVHNMLGTDIYQVFHFNEIDPYDQEVPDGLVMDGAGKYLAYDVKNLRGGELKVSERQVKRWWLKFYILCMLIGDEVHIIGYADCEMMIRGRHFHYPDGTLGLALKPPDKLQSFDEFLRLFKR